ncbi:MAG: TonB-dependent receptor, partial [Alphaproteobacteria bacterium]|nr:TonB-dependent receptor [Alphaproteobacteria bacterium]
DVYKRQKQSDLTYIELKGDHLLKPWNNSLLKWSGAYSYAFYNEPDKRKYTVDNVTGDFKLQRAGNITRKWLESSEHGINFKPQLQIPFPIWQQQTARAYLGAGINYKHRRVYQRNLSYEQGLTGSNDLLNSFTTVDDLIKDEHLVGLATNKNQLSLTEDPNFSYQGDILIVNGYFKLDLPVSEKIKLSTGLNYEFSKMNVFSYNVFTNEENSTNLLRTNILIPHNFLPSFNLAFSPIKKMNLRSSYSYSVARPDFREAVDLFYVLNRGGAAVFGNTNLIQTGIHSADLRFEIYPGRHNLFALSGFYKFIEDPVEFLQLAPSSQDDIKYQFRNGVSAQNLGLEAELKLGFGFINKILNKLELTGNFTYIWSAIE